MGRMTMTLMILTVSYFLCQGSKLIPDVLASFNKPNTKAPSTAPPQDSLPPGLVSDDQDPEVDDEDFDASLVEGMEALLRQLAGDHPPGPMPGTTSTDDSGNGKKSELSPEEEEKAFQRAIEMMLSTEGMAAMGLDDKGDKKSTPKPSGSASAKKQSTTAKSTSTSGESSKPDVPAFEETIRKAMESLNSAGGPASSGAGGGPSDPAELAKLLASLGNDSNLDLDGDDELTGILDGMMGQLMTREVLEEPLSELASKVNFPH
jgi:peroxin-19